ncbi:MAG: hypothetical protein GY719_00595 [bacterium]|nr:hypothetical protein [bacterium]
MESQSKLFLTIAVAVTLVFAVILLQPTVEERLAPELQAAWVAIEVAGSGIADVGPVELDVGTPFQLHAVLEARDRNSGEPVYYTEAKRLSFTGEEVPPESLEVWERRRPIKIRWFTVEGRRPFVQLDAELGIRGFDLQEFLRSNWPLAWSVPGEIDTANDNHLASDSAEKIQRFGTQRYHVRIEFYPEKNALIPDQVIRSWGIPDLKEQIERFPTVRMTLPPPARTASAVFGLTQLEPLAGTGAEIHEQIAELAASGVAFSRLTIIGDQIRQAGMSLEDLTWTTVDLAGEARWGEQAGPGDLLRVGDRVVVLYADRGEPGVVDYEDLCFDYVQGAAIRALNDVFIGSGNAVELASLGGARAMQTGA